MSISLFQRAISLLTPPSAPSVPIHSSSIIRQLLAENDGKNVLDLGSGGRVLNSDVVRLDIVPNPNITVQGDACHLPFANSAFDLVICSHVLEHVKSYWLASNELRRVTKPGGIILIETPFIFPFHTATPVDRHDYVRFTLEGLRSMVSKDEIIKYGLAVGHGSMLMLILLEWVSRFFYTKSHTGLYYLVRNTLSWLFYPLCWLDRWLDNMASNDVIGGAYYIVAKRGQD